VMERTAQLREANAELEAFSYSVSHDLRGPLRAIDGYSRMFVEDFGDSIPLEAQKFIQSIRSNSLRMGALIDDLLSFAHIGRATIRPAPIDMRELAQETWREANHEGNIRFDLGPLPAALGDRALLKQVWVNLLGNACKYSGKQPSPQVTVSATSPGETEVVYSVADNGTGFDMRYYEKLFGVFQRLHSQDEFPGTGVGLAIAHRVITRLGGRIWAESTPGEGATFHFSLPAVTLH